MTKQKHFRAPRVRKAVADIQSRGSGKQKRSQTRSIKPKRGK